MIRNTVPVGGRGSAGMAEREAKGNLSAAGMAGTPVSFYGRGDDPNTGQNCRQSPTGGRGYDGFELKTGSPPDFLGSSKENMFAILDSANGKSYDRNIVSRRWEQVMQQSLFDRPNMDGTPLASRIRPRDLSEFIGQEHLLGEGKVLRNLIERDQISSMIFWGPPGDGQNYPCQESLPGAQRHTLRTSAQSPAE